MSEQSKRREAVRAYKERRQVGGLYRLVNRETGWRGPLCATPNLQGMQNRFAFACKTGSCFDEVLRAQWAVHSPAAFALEVVEELAQKPETTTAEFREELAALRQLYEEGEAR